MKRLEFALRLALPLIAVGLAVATLLWLRPSPEAPPIPHDLLDASPGIDERTTSARALQSRAAREVQQAESWTEAPAEVRHILEDLPKARPPRLQAKGSTSPNPQRMMRVDRLKATAALGDQLDATPDLQKMSRRAARLRGQVEHAAPRPPR